VHDKDDSLHQEQKKVRPKAEDVVSEYLADGAKINALDFIAYFRANQMPPQWTSGNSWKINYKKKSVCYIRLINGYWHICLAFDFSEYEEFIADKNITELIWESLKPCESCLPCRPGKKIAFSGKEFNNICGYNTVQIRDPDAAKLIIVKKIIETRRNHIVSENI
jgi:hypothetical protein